MSAVRLQAPPAEALVPVHTDVQFKYTTSFAALGGSGSIAAPRGGGGGGGAGLAGTQDRGTQKDVAQRPALEEILDDFISFDAPIEEAAPMEQQPPAAAAAAVAAASRMGSALLDDYVALGLIADPAAAAAADAKAATPCASSRPEQLKAVPWVGSLKGIRSPLLRLHQEVVEFCRYLAPSPGEQAARQAAIDSIEEVVTSIWPKARVEVFGSFATGLYLPTSDVDAVVMGSGCTDIPQGLKALANALARRNMAKNMQVIAKAKVPIVKFEDAGSGYNFDLSFDVANGPEAAENVRALMDSLPPMRPLVMVLKVFLQQRELNEVYSGGLGSYALLVMVAAFLQLHPSRQPTGAAPRYGSSKSEGRARELEGNLGVLLADFFRLYGRALNNTEVGVSCRKGGSYYNKRTKGFFQAERPFLYSVEDPNDQSNDLGRNSYNISRVRMAFDWAYCQLTAPSDPGVSLLQRIIRLDPVLFARAPPPPPEDDEPAALIEEDKAAKKKKKKKKEKGEKQRGREVSEEAEAEEEAEGEEEEGRQRQAKRHKRRHRERSLSDSDQGGRGRGAAARRRHLESDSDAEPEKGRAGDDMEESSSADEEERRRQHKKHRHKHHQQHHSSGGGGKGHHQKHGGSGERRHEEGQHHRRHSKGSSGGGSRHVYFD